MGRGVDLLELADGDVGVALGRGQAGMAEQGLMNRTSAPPSSMWVAQARRSRWVAPGLAMPARVLARRTASAACSG
jgi:hypothetical protein